MTDKLLFKFLTIIIFRRIFRRNMIGEFTKPEQKEVTKTIDRHPMFSTPFGMQTRATM